MAGRLLLYCTPLVEGAAGISGTAWGLPVVREGAKRLSALALSEKLSAPGKGVSKADSAFDRLAEERLKQLEALGIGPLGRYTGGEPIRPLRLDPGEFFGFKRVSLKTGLRFAGLEYGGPPWPVSGTAAELFRLHLEFLRRWGFSGGVTVEEQHCAELLGDYLRFLHGECGAAVGGTAAGAKILVLTGRDFFTNRLAPRLERAGAFADPAVGAIPVNYLLGGDSVLAAPFCGLGIVLREDLPPALRSIKARCDILITVDSAGKTEDSAAGIEARLRLAVSAEGREPEKKPPGEKTAAEKKPSLPAYLYRSLLPGRNGQPPSLAFPSQGGKGKGEKGETTGTYQPLRRGFWGTREEAAALDVLPQWEAGRVGIAGGSGGAGNIGGGKAFLFAVNAKFSGLRAADFKEEQAAFYREVPEKTAFSGTAFSKTERAGTAIRPGAAFADLDEAQRLHFLRWRSEYRRNRSYSGAVETTGDMEAYIRLYAKELVLCMGREGPLEHFLALKDLFRSCREAFQGSTGTAFSGTMALLCRWLVDCAVLHGIADAALPFLVEELEHDGDWYGFLRENGMEEAADLLLDWAICRLFVENKHPPPETAVWPILRSLIPDKIIQRKEGADTVGAGADTVGAGAYRAECCRTLMALDGQLRRDWNRGFFELFYPPRPVRTDVAALKGLSGLGESSWTVYRPGFSSHKPLLDVIAALALDPSSNPLPGVEARLRPLSLEGELLDELRRESDAVRELLSVDANDTPGTQGAPSVDTVNPGGGTASVNRQGSADPAGSAAAAMDGDPEKFTSCEASPSRRAWRDRHGCRNLPCQCPPAYRAAPDRAALDAFVSALEKTEQEVLRSIIKQMPVSELAVDRINEIFYERFGDLVVETGSGPPSISAEYGAILQQWESASPGG